MTDGGWEPGAGMSTTKAPKACDWGNSLSNELLQEIARRVGASSWGTLRCVCQNWRLGISLAVQNVRFTVPDRSTLFAVRQLPEPDSPAEPPRGTRKGAATTRPLFPPSAIPDADRQAAAADRTLSHAVAATAAAGAPGVAAAIDAASPLAEAAADGRPPSSQPQPHDTLIVNVGRGYTVSTGRPKPLLPAGLQHLHPPQKPAGAAIQNGAAAGVALPGATAPVAAVLAAGAAVATARPGASHGAAPSTVAAAAEVVGAAGSSGEEETPGEPSSDTADGDAPGEPLLRPCEGPDLAPWTACGYNPHLHSSVAAAAAAAANTAAAAWVKQEQNHHLQYQVGQQQQPAQQQQQQHGEAPSDSHAAGVASSVGSSSIVVWNFLEAADKLSAAYPAFTNLNLDFSEPLPLNATWGSDGGNWRWLQAEISAALQQLLSIRLVSLSLSGHTPYPLVFAPPPLPLPLLPLRRHPEQGPGLQAGPIVQHPPHKLHKLASHAAQESGALVNPATWNEPAAEAAAGAAVTIAATGIVVGGIRGNSAGASEGRTGVSLNQEQQNKQQHKPSPQPMQSEEWLKPVLHEAVTATEAVVGAEGLTVAGALEAMGQGLPAAVFYGTAVDDCLDASGANNQVTIHRRRGRGPSEVPSAAAAVVVGPAVAATAAGLAASPPALGDSPIGARARPRGDSTETGAAAAKAADGPVPQAPGTTGCSEPLAASAGSAPEPALAVPHGSLGSVPSRGSPSVLVGCEGGSAGGHSDRAGTHGYQQDVLSDGLGRACGLSETRAGGVDGTPPAAVRPPPQRNGSGSGAVGDGSVQECAANHAPTSPVVGTAAVAVGNNGSELMDTDDPQDSPDAALAVLMETNGSGQGTSEHGLGSAATGDDGDLYGSNELCRTMQLNLAGIKPIRPHHAALYPRPQLEQPGGAAAVPTDVCQVEDSRVPELKRAAVGCSSGKRGLSSLAEGEEAEEQDGGGSSDGNRSCRAGTGKDGTAAAPTAAVTTTATRTGAALGPHSGASGRPRLTRPRQKHKTSPASAQPLGFLAAPGDPSRTCTAAAAAAATAAAAGGAPWAEPKALVAAALAAARPSAVRPPPLLSRLSQLQSLTLVSDLGFPSPAHLEAITALHELQVLDMRGTKFMQVDGDASLLNRHACAHVGNDHVAVLARCTSLTSLSINHVHSVSGQQLEALTALSRLTALRLTDALSGNAVHGAHLQALAAGLTGLASLEIGRVTCPSLTFWQPPAAFGDTFAAAATAAGGVGGGTVGGGGCPPASAGRALCPPPPRQTQQQPPSSPLAAAAGAIPTPRGSWRDAAAAAATAQERAPGPAGVAGVSASWVPGAPAAVGPAVTEGLFVYQPEQPWGPMLGAFQRLTSLHLQVACSFEPELLSGVASLPLLDDFSLELLDVPPPQLAVLLQILSSGTSAPHPSPTDGTDPWVGPGARPGGGRHRRRGQGATDGSAGGGDSGIGIRSDGTGGSPAAPVHGGGRGGGGGSRPRRVGGGGAAAGIAAASGRGGGLGRVLHGLTLTACMLYDEHLVLMGRLHHLRSIRLDHVDIRTRDPDGWTALSSVRCLELFSFREWNNPVLSAGNLCVLTNDSLAMMAANWPRLQQLTYYGKVALTEKADEHFTRMTHLRSAEITGTDGTSGRVWRSAATGQLLRTITVPYAPAKVSSRNGYVTYSDSDDSDKSEGSEASVNWMGEKGYVTSEYDAD